MTKISTVAAMLILFLASLTVAGAQSNDRIDELLAQETARFDSVAYLVLAASGHISSEDSPEAALAALGPLGLPSLDPTGPINVEQLSYLLMKAFDLKGGFMYSILPGTRYAYKEMSLAKVVIDTAGPYRSVGGEEAIRSLRYAIELKGGAQ